MYRFFAIILVLCPTSSLALEPPADRTLKLTGPILDDALSVASEIDQLSKRAKDPIWIVINSPGGRLDVGAAIMASMNQARQRGLQLYCVVGRRAASMALYLLGECSKRWAFPLSELTFHQAGFFTHERLTTIDLERSIRELKLQESLIVEPLRVALRWSVAQFRDHYLAETSLFAKELERQAPHFINLISTLEGQGPEIWK